MTVKVQDGIHHLMCDSCGGEMLATSGIINIEHVCSKCRKRCVAERAYPYEVVGYSFVELDHGTVVKIERREQVYE